MENNKKNHETLEEVLVKYKLSDEEHDRIGQEIINIFMHDKFPVKNPKIIIDIAPPASGKTGLNAFGTQEFLDDNVIIINSDEFKPFHPRINEIATSYPQYYTKITDQESNTWTSALFEKALSEKYNIIFEGTGKNSRILDTIKSKMQGYEVIVRSLAVNELNCLISILDRYEHQIRTKGNGRLVTYDHFMETYNAVPNTIDDIEKSDLIKDLEIYSRGHVPSQPQLLYNTSTREYSRFPNAKYAILAGRKEDFIKAQKYYEEHIEELKRLVYSKEPIQAEIDILDKIEEIYINDIKSKLEGNGDLTV